MKGISFSRKNLFKYDLPGDIFERLNGKPSLAIDTEATGLNIHRDRLCLVQICDSTGETYLVHFPENIYNKSINLRKLLSNKKIKKIFHFARFDVSILCKYLGVLCKNIMCTRTMSRIARTFSDKHGIKTVCKEILDVELNKTSQSSYWGDELLSDSQVHYAMADVVNLHSLHESLERVLKREKRYKISQMACEAIPVAAYFDCNFFDLPSLLNYQS